MQLRSVCAVCAVKSTNLFPANFWRLCVVWAIACAYQNEERRQTMSTRQRKPQDSIDQTLWQKMVCLLNKIRFRMAYWNIVTTATALLLLGGLFYSTTAQNLPLPEHTSLQQIEFVKDTLQLCFFLGLVILLVFT